MDCEGHMCLPKCSPRPRACELMVSHVALPCWAASDSGQNSTGGLTREVGSARLGDLTCWLLLFGRDAGLAVGRVQRRGDFICSASKENIKIKSATTQVNFQAYNSKNHHKTKICDIVNLNYTTHSPLYRKNICVFGFQ